MNLIRLSIHWEFHHPNWRTPSFFRGVGIPSITRDDYRWLHVLIVCYEHMRIHKGSVDPHRTSSCGFQILGWSNDVSINEAMSTCSLSVVYPLKLSIFLNDIWSIYGQMVVTYSDITTRSTRDLSPLLTVCSSPKLLGRNSRVHQQNGVMADSDRVEVDTDSFTGGFDYYGDVLKIFTINNNQQT